jgi:Flp pilus assembly protein TadD
MTVDEARDRGRRCQEAGDLEGAERAYREADELHDAESAILLGLVLKQRGDLPNAADAFRRAEARGHPEAASSLGTLLWESGDVEGAKAAYERARWRQGMPMPCSLLG